jgi:hypothetical protein
VKKTAGVGFGIKVKQYFFGKNIFGAGRKAGYSNSKKLGAYWGFLTWGHNGKKSNSSLILSS